MSRGPGGPGGPGRRNDRGRGPERGPGGPRHDWGPGWGPHYYGRGGGGFFGLIIICLIFINVLWPLLPVIIAGAAIYFGYKAIKKKQEEKQIEEENERQAYYDNFFDSKEMDDQPFDKNDFFNSDQSSGLDVIDAQVKEIKKEDSNAKYFDDDEY